MILFSAISEAEQWMLGCNIVMALCTMAALAVMFFKKTDTQISPQPLIVAMEKEFTTRRDFDAHVTHNATEHDKIFSKIGGVERGAHNTIEARVEGVRKDLVVVGNHVAGLQATTEQQNQTLARIDAKLDRLAERS